MADDETFDLGYAPHRNSGSGVWAFFDRISEQEVACHVNGCNYRAIRTKSSTSIMWTHLKCHHRAEYMAILGQKKRRPDEDVLDMEQAAASESSSSSSSIFSKLLRTMGDDTAMYDGVRNQHSEINNAMDGLFGAATAIRPPPPPPPPPVHHYSSAPPPVPPIRIRKETPKAASSTAALPPFSTTNGAGATSGGQSIEERLMRNRDRREREIHQLQVEKLKLEIELLRRKLTSPDYMM